MGDSVAMLLRNDRDGVATLTLNRPGARNALSMGLMSALEEALEAVAGDGSVRVVVIGGPGRRFVPGMT